MTGQQHTIILSALLCVQILGLISAAVARLSEGSSFQTPSHCLFLGTLGLVGAVTMATLLLGPGCWLSSGTTLSLMVLTATCDFSRSSQRATDWPTYPPSQQR